MGRLNIGLAPAAVAFAAALVAAAVGVVYASVASAVMAGALVALETLVLYAHGRRLAGPRLGLAAAAAVVVVPLLGIVYAQPAYRSTYRREALPALLGATHTGWLALGVAFGAALLVVPRRLVAIIGVVALVAAFGTWGTLTDVRTALHETGWSVTFAAWLVVAGLLGVARRSWSLALGLTGWLAIFVLRAGQRPFAGGAFWEALAPIAPAAALLFVAIALLVPRLRARQPRPAA
jgi:hypothetical protein